MRPRRTARRPSRRTGCPLPRRGVISTEMVGYLAVTFAVLLAAGALVEGLGRRAQEIQFTDRVAALMGRMAEHRQVRNDWVGIDTLEPFMRETEQLGALDSTNLIITSTSAGTITFTPGAGAVGPTPARAGALNISNLDPGLCRRLVVRVLDPMDRVARNLSQVSAAGGGTASVSSAAAIDSLDIAGDVCDPDEEVTLTWTFR